MVVGLEEMLRVHNKFILLTIICDKYQEHTFSNGSDVFKIKRSLPPDGARGRIGRSP